jgi:anti-sigma factor RsiW
MDPDCPSIETLAAFVDGFALEDRLQLEAHLVACEICRATVALGLTTDSDRAGEDRRPTPRAREIETLPLTPQLK